MTKTADVVVIGGGVVGVCAAYYLSRHSRRVVVLEKGQVGEGCSYANACLITPSHSHPVAGPGVITQGLKWMFHADSPLLIRPRLDPRFFSWIMRFAAACREERVDHAIPILRDLSRASLALYVELAETENLSFDFERRGLLGAYMTEAGFAKGRREAELLRRHGFNPKLLDSKEARALEPAMVETKGAVYFEEDAHGDCHQFVRGMTEAAKRRGVEFYPNTQVVAVRKGHDAEVLVKTAEDEYHAGDVLLATGSWTTQLLKGVGLALPLQAGKGYSVTMDRPPKSPRIPVMNLERKMVVTPIGDRLRFAGTMEFAGLDLTINEKRSDAVFRAGLEILAERPTPTNVKRWCGLRPCTPDSLPIIDRVPGFPHGYIATGHGMLGFTLGPISGKLVAEMIVTGHPSMDISGMQISRF